MRGGKLIQEVRKYFNEVAQQLRVAVQDVDWRLELPLCDRRNRPLTVEGLRPYDVENQLTAEFWYLMGTLESMFLLREHELLQAQSDPHWKAPVHSYKQPHITVAPDPQPPKDLASVHFRVGSDGLYPLVQAVHEIVGGLLREFRSRIPHNTWHSICMHCMYFVEAKLVEQAAALNPAGGLRTTDAENRMLCTNSGQSRLLAMNKCVLLALHSASVEPAVEVGHSGGRTLQEVESRIAVLQGTLSCYLAHIIWLQKDSGLGLLMQAAVHKGIISTSTIMARLLTLLQLSSTQKTLLAAVWRYWCSRREAMSGMFVEAVALLTDTLPHLHTLDLALIRTVDAACNLRCSAHEQAEHGAYGGGHREGFGEASVGEVDGAMHSLSVSGPAPDDEDRESADGPEGSSVLNDNEQHSEAAAPWEHGEHYPPLSSQMHGYVTLLAEDAAMQEAQQGAMRDILEIHRRDRRMMLETLPPFPALNPVQHCVLMAAVVETGHPGPIILHLCKLVAETLASEALFRDAGVDND